MKREEDSTITRGTELNQSNDPTTPANDTFALVTSVTMLLILTLGAASMIVIPNPFWLVVSVWAIVLVALPAQQHRGQRFLPWWLLVPISLPFIANLIGIIADFRPLEFSAPLSWLISGVGLFFLCLITTTFIDVSGEMNMNRSFFIVVVFFFLASITVIQGWVSWYTDLALGTTIVGSNADYMVYYILVTIAGLVLTFLINSYFKRRPYERFRSRVWGAGR